MIYTDGAKKAETGVTGFGVAIPDKGGGINRRTSDRLGVDSGDGGSAGGVTMGEKGKTGQGVNMLRCSFSPSKPQIFSFKQSARHTL